MAEPLQTGFPISKAPERPDIQEGLLGRTEGAGATLPETAMASWDLATINSSYDSIKRRFTLNELKERDEPKLSAAELNKKYEGQTDKPFAEDMTDSAAKEIVRTSSEERRLQNIVDAGAKGFIPGAVNLTSSSVSLLMDPVELSLNVGAFLVTGGLSSAATVGRFGALGVRAAEMANLARESGVLGRSAVTFGRELAEGAVAAGVGEFAFVRPQRQQELSDLSIAESFNHVAQSAVLGAGLVTGAGLAWHGVGRTKAKVKEFSTNRSKNFEKNLETVAVNQAEANLKPDVGPIIKEYVKELDGPSATLRPADELSAARGAPLEYAHQPVADLVEIKDIDFYTGSAANRFDPTGAPLDSIPNGSFFGGEGVYLDSSHVRANGTYGSKFAELPGGIVRASIKNPESLLDLRSKAPDFLLDILKQEAPILGKGELKDALSVATGKEAFDLINELIEAERIKPEAMKNIQAALETQGKTGYFFETNRVLDEDISPSHGIYLFKSDGMAQTGKFNPDLKSVPKLSKQEQLELLKNEAHPSRRLGYDDDSAKRLLDAEEKPNPKAFEEKDILDAINTKLEEGELSELTSEAVLKEVKDDISKVETKRNLFNTVANCLLGKG